MSLSQHKLQRSDRATSPGPAESGEYGSRAARPMSPAAGSGAIAGGPLARPAPIRHSSPRANLPSPLPRGRGERNLSRGTHDRPATGGAAKPPAPGAAAQAGGPARAERAARAADPAGERLSLRAFWRGRRGSVAVETAIATALLVIAFAGVMQIVHSAYVSDRMDRAARSAARAIAFTPGANAASLPGLACQAIRKELDLGEGFDCATRFSVEIENRLAPASLTESAGSEHATPAGELVRVRISWSGGPWNPGILLSGDDADSRPVAIAIARLEPIEGA